MELNPPSFISYVTGHGMPARLAMISQEAAAVLSTPAAFAWTFAGGAFAGVFLFLIFALKGWLTPGPAKATSSDEDCEPLLPESGGSCGPAGWHAPAPAPKVETPGSETTFSVLIFSTLMALPSVLGTWCWPLLLVALFPAANSNIESDENKEITHHFTFGADVVLFTSMIFYVARSPYRSGLRYWGPLAMVALGGVLLTLDPTRHILLDHGGVFFDVNTLAMFRNGGLSPIGKVCQMSSIAGLALLFFGLLWFMTVPEDGVKSL